MNHESNSPDEARTLAREHELYDAQGYGGLLLQVAEGAISVRNESDPGTLYWAVTKGIHVVESIVYATNDAWWKLSEEGKKPKYWHHIERPMFSNKKRAEPYLPVREVEEAASLYLDLPFRTNGLDRILIDMLIASEMLAFADEMQAIVNRPASPVLAALFRVGLTVLVAFGISALSQALFPDSRWLHSLINGLSYLLLGGALIAAALFPFGYPRYKRQGADVTRRLDAMRDAYAALNGTPASTRHVEERIARATEQGVIWPAPLHVLIEDIRARKVSF